MAKVRTPIQTEYHKQLSRIKRGIRELKKQGYNITYELPKTPKRITSKSVEKLRKITRSDIRKGSTYVSRTTGEVMTGEQALHQRRSEGAKKAAISRKYLPTITDIGERRISDYVDKFLTEETLEGLISFLQNAENDSQFYSMPPRSRNYTKRLNAIFASTSVRDNLINLISSIISESGGLRITESSSKIQEELERAMFGYDEQEVYRAYSTVVSMLTGRALSAEEAKDLDEE